MSVSATLIRSLNGIGTPVNTSVAYTAGASINLSEDIPASQTDLQIAFDLDVSETVAIIMVSNENLTVCTNDASGGSPDETISLIAGEPYIFTDDDAAMGLVDVLATDLTDFYVTNTTACTLDVRCLYDPTP